MFFEQKNFDQCIEVCEKAIEIGRENRADFKLIAKAFVRIANAYKQKEVSWFLVLILFFIISLKVPINYFLY